MALASIYKNTESIPYRITIVDDGSSEENLRALRQISGIRLIEHGRNLGPAMVSITGFKNTNSDIVVLMDNDVIVSKNWLKILSKYFEDPGVGIVSPLRYSDKYKYPKETISSREKWEKTKRLNGSPADWLRLYLGESKDLEEFRDRLVQWNGINDETVKAPPDFVSSSCILLNRGVVNSCGGIASQGFLHYGGEDVDLSWRIGSGGYKVIRSCGAYVHHFEHSSVDERNLNRQRLLEENNLILYNIWGKQILDDYGQNQYRNYPFVKLFKEIKNGGPGKVF